MQALALDLFQGSVYFFSPLLVDPDFVSTAQQELHNTPFGLPIPPSDVVGNWTQALPTPKRNKDSNEELFKHMQMHTTTNTSWL